MDDLLSEIEAFCRSHQMRESRFGRDAVNDTSLVAQIRSGREPRRRTVARVRDFMATHSAADTATSRRPRSNRPDPQAAA